MLHTLYDMMMRDAAGCTTDGPEVLSARQGEMNKIAVAEDS